MYRIILTLLLASAPTWPAAPQTATLTRYITFKTCDSRGKCGAPIAEQVETDHSEVVLELLPAGKVPGLAARDHYTAIKDDLAFKSEILLIKYKQPGKFKYYIYAMLRSGKREGKIKRMWFNDFSEASRVVLVDLPVQTQSGTLQARLVFGIRRPLSGGE